jgi:hypothetical protein
LETTLNQLDFLKDGKISLKESGIYFAKMDSTAKASVREPLDYLADTYGMESVQPFFTDSIGKDYIYKVISDLSLRFNNDQSADTQHYFSFNVQNIELPDISIYRSFVYIDTSNCDTLTIPIQKNILKLAKRDKTNIPFSTQDKDIVIDGNDYSLYVKHANGNYYSQNDSITIFNFEGFLFYK